MAGSCGDAKTPDLLFHFETVIILFTFRVEVN